VIGCEINTDSLFAALREAHDRQGDLSGVLRVHGREMRQEAREVIDSGEGMPPLAASTLEKRLHMGRGQITQQGKVRASVAQQLKRHTDRLAALKKWSDQRYLGLGRHLMPADVRQKLDRLEQRTERLARQAQKAATLNYTARTSGTLRQLQRKREGVAAALAAAPHDAKLVKKLGVLDKQIERRQAPTKLLGRTPSTLFYVVKQKGDDFLLLVASHWGKSGVHNDGDNHVPQRRFLWLQQKRVDAITRDIVRYVLEPLRGG